MNTSVLNALPVAAMLVASGCVGRADVMMPHPIVAGEVPKETEIEKPESLVESSNGLPMGTLTQRARLLKLDEKKACFGVELHGLRPDLIDPRQLTVVLKDQPSGNHMEGATITGGRPSSKTFQGLVAEQERVGTETFCASRNADQICQSWQTRPTYVTRMVPGPVTVYETASKVCFEHDGLVTTKSQRIILDLHKIQMVGFMPQRVGGIDFRWGFSGASKN